MTQVTAASSRRLVRFTTDHDYFDWIEDISVQRQRIIRPTALGTGMMKGELERAAGVSG